MIYLDLMSNFYVLLTVNLVLVLIIQKSNLRTPILYEI